MPMRPDGNLTHRPAAFVIRSGYSVRYTSAGSTLSVVLILSLRWSNLTPRQRGPVQFALRSADTAGANRTQERSSIAQGGGIAPKAAAVTPVEVQRAAT